MNDLTAMYPSDKKECYSLIHAQLKSLYENERHLIPNLANASALLNLALVDINWVGFYLLYGEELLLGPFQGKPACIHIPVGQGVCGTAVAEKKPIMVKDVHTFPGHIACDSASRSEIVLPIWHKDKIVGVLDIDSPYLSRFDETDLDGLTEVVRIIETGCDWSEL